MDICPIGPGIVVEAEADRADSRQRLDLELLKNLRACAASSRVGREQHVATAGSQRNTQARPGNDRRGEGDRCRIRYVRGNGIGAIYIEFIHAAGRRQLTRKWLAAGLQNIDSRI